MPQAPLDMLRDKHIGVLHGGQSGEREVSLRSGQGVLDALARQGFTAVSIDPGPDLISQLREADVNVVFNALHGGAGEDGTIPALLDYAAIPYTGSGMVASALAMNKLLTKRLLRSAGLPTPDFVHVTSQVDLNDQVSALIDHLGLPVVTKPLAECSGPEITVGVLGVGETLRALPVLELVPHKEFYDYEAKYTEGLTELIVPARISPQATQSAQEIAVQAHQELGCVGISRVDMHLGGDGQVWVHELNTIPGLTELSDIPAAAAAAGMSYDEVILEILASATTRL